MIKDLKIEHVDTESSFGGRILKIITSNNSFETPCRVVTSTENRYKRDLTLSPLDNKGELPVKVYEYVKGFREGGNIKKLHKNSGFLKEQLKQIDDNLRGYDNALTFTTLQYPSDTILTDEDIVALVYLQCRSIADCVEIPEMTPNVSVETYLKILKPARRTIEWFGKEPVPTIYMHNENVDLFREKIEAIAGEEFKMAILKYANFDEFFPNYACVKEIAKEHEILFHLTGVPRVVSRSQNNYVHIPQIFGIDLSSPRTPIFGGEIPPRTPENTRRFDSISLGNLTLTEHIEEYGEDLGCTCPVCKNKNVVEYIGEYSSCPNSKVNNPIYLYSRMHEIFASVSEFDQGKKYIKKGQTEEYFANKKHAKGIITNLAKVMNDYKHEQKTLLDFS